MQVSLILTVGITVIAYIIGVFMGILISEIEKKNNNN